LQPTVELAYAWLDVKLGSALRKNCENCGPAAESWNLGTLIEKEYRDTTPQRQGNFQTRGIDKFFRGTAVRAGVTQMAR
jgi:hypothetical protein